MSSPGPTTGPDGPRAPLESESVRSGAGRHDVVLARLRRAGWGDVTALEPALGGLAATAGFARRPDGTAVFVKTFLEPPSDDAFLTEPRDSRRSASWAA